MINKLKSKEYQGIGIKLMAIGIVAIKARYINIFFFVIIPSLEKLVLIKR